MAQTFPTIFFVVTVASRDEADFVVRNTVGTVVAVERAECTVPIWIFGKHDLTKRIGRESCSTPAELATTL